VSELDHKALYREALGVPEPPNFFIAVTSTFNFSSALSSDVLRDLFLYDAYVQRVPAESKAVPDE
jgi:hypothetical protein